MNVIKFEREPCSRCGGSGQYSYCQRFGTTCFKCGGSGKQLTRRGAKARDTVQTLRLALTETHAAAVRPGDWIMIDNRKRLVTEVRPDPNPGYTMFVLKTTTNSMMECAGYATGGTIERCPTIDQFQMMIDLARTLPGATVETRTEATK